MPPFLRVRIPSRLSPHKKGPQMGPFFKFVLAESWGCPGMLRMPSGFKAWRLFAHGLQTLSRLLNARALSGSNPQRPFSIIKKGPRWDPSLKLNWRRAGDSNPRCPFGAYSLSRRAPSASRSALRNSRSIVTKQSRMGKREFGAIPFLPFPHRLQQIVAHVRNCKRNTAIARGLNQPRIDQTLAI